ncbi:hypothetical protein QZH41_017495 [Actinostola sp. cb2023]|nr:hypothetical protein QZH41_017495 [Actinostola sp. cb2023]
MERDPNTKEGENIFYMYGGDPSEACDRAVENWYSELRNYDFKNPHESPSTDHFSQVIWKDTKEIGVGTAQSKSGNFFLVARYKPSVTRRVHSMIMSIM